MIAEYTTNTEKRCMYCKGREVKTWIDGQIVNVNLEEPVKNLFRCKNIKECQQNLEAENTQVHISKNGYKIIKDYNETIIEVEYDKSVF